VDFVAEQKSATLKEAQRLIETWHDASFGVVTHVAVASCSPFSVSQHLMRESAKLARANGIRLHTHFAENDHDIAYTQEKFNCAPAQYAKDLVPVATNMVLGLVLITNPKFPAKNITLD